MNEDNYFDLTASENDIDTLEISPSDNFNCVLKDTSRDKTYSGFILARSHTNVRLTVCDVSFQRSATDNKYQPRLVFRRTKRNLEDVDPLSSVDHVRLSFSSGADGYRNFWKMIFFLYKFKEEVDFGEFENSYQVVTRQQFQTYLADSANYEEITELAEGMNVDVSKIMKPISTLKLLKSCKEKLTSFINNGASETDVQNWIDEDNGIHRKERCMIFGLEYIDFKREGDASSKKFDILTRVGLKNIERVLIELKSPSDDIFKIVERDNNNGISQEYHLHDKLARAIPQILEYKSILEKKDAGDPDLTEIGINEKVVISKCIIVIGKNSDDSRWKQNRINLSDSLNSSLEVWTYADLLNKLTSTIQNIEGEN